MDPDELENRAQLHLAVTRLAATHRALTALTPGAATRIGLTAADMDRIGLLTSRALWSSTADLHQVGRREEAAQVIARAVEIDREDL